MRVDTAALGPYSGQTPAGTPEYMEPWGRASPQRQPERTQDVAKSSGKKTTKKTTKKAAKKASNQAPKSASKPKAKAKKASKPKSPLTRAELKEMRTLLLEKRRELVGDMNGMESGSRYGGREGGPGNLSTVPTHQADVGSDNYEQEFTLGLLESERTLLKEIHEALERIDEGTFGICLGTGQPIGIPRLKARPWAKYCIEYARMIEKGLVRPGEPWEPEDDEEDDEDEE